MLFKMLWVERTHSMFQDTLAKPRQVFVTQSRVLARKVEEYFIKLSGALGTSLQSPDVLKSIRAQQEDFAGGGLVDLDEDPSWKKGLPDRFSQLADVHFPLFTTFDDVGPFFGYALTLSSFCS